MKKLILVTALAVAASWLLSEPGRPGEEQAARAEVARVERALKNRINRDLVLDDGMTVQIQPGRPTPPEPPTPPGSIRTVPWNRRTRSLVEKTDGTPPPASPEAMFQGPASRRIPDWFPRTDADEQAAARPDASGSRVLLGRLSASEDRARRDLRATVEREVAAWLAADAPPSWKPPASLIDAMVRGSHVREVTKDLTTDGLADAAKSGAYPNGQEPEALTPVPPSEVAGLYTLYRAGQKLDFSTTRRADFLAEYRRELAAARLQRLGGGLAVALVGLAVLSGYIKADEATKGYYTNRLRLLAGAGLGAAGVAAYRILA